MTSAEVARILRAKRVGRGKYMAKCPAHREKTGSLSISDMGAGCTRVHCFAGCAQADVLRAAGLTWRDLKPGGAVDPEIRGRLADEAKLEKLNRQFGLVLWLEAIEPERSRYWQAAIRRILREIEPLYWKLMPDKERFDRIRAFETKQYRNRRLDWLYEHRRQHGIHGSGNGTKAGKVEVQPERIH